MSRARNVLFLCTGNSARSILAEAILNREGKGCFRAFSAGSFPRGDVHPAALRLLQDLGYPTADLRSKSWDEFAADKAPPIHFVITVCDSAAGESCPLWPGRPITAHWGIEDPAAADESGREKAFADAYHALKRRIDLLLALPLESIDDAALQQRLRAIGEAESALG